MKTVLAASRKSLDYLESDIQTQHALRSQIASLESELQASQEEVSKFVAFPTVMTVQPQPLDDDSREKVLALEAQVSKLEAEMSSRAEADARARDDLGTKVSKMEVIIRTQEASLLAAREEDERAVKVRADLEARIKEMEAGILAAKKEDEKMLRFAAKAKIDRNLADKKAAARKAEADAKAEQSVALKEAKAKKAVEREHLRAVRNYRNNPNLRNKVALHEADDHLLSSSSVSSAAKETQRVLEDDVDDADLQLEHLMSSIGSRPSKLSRGSDPKRDKFKELLKSLKQDVKNPLNSNSNSNPPGTNLKSEGPRSPGSPGAEPYRPTWLGTGP